MATPSRVWYTTFYTQLGSPVKVVWTPGTTMVVAYGMRVETYPTPIEKIALIAAATRVSKEVTIKEEGIGEDLPFSLMVWREASLTAICQLDSELRDEHPGERLIRTVEAAAACRWGFDATAFTFVTEGYCATDPALVDPTVPLVSQFVANPDVRECLTVTHMEAGNIYLSALPYSYAVGRKVVWDEALHYEPTFAGSNQFLGSMLEILLKDFADRDAVGDGEAAAREVSRWGFHIQWGLDLDEMFDPDLYDAE